MIALKSYDKALAIKPDHAHAPNRRMTRLTNAFSKKAVNHTHMMAIYFMHYNFVRIHQTLKITPAMAANVTDRLWEMSDMVKVLEGWETVQKAAA